MNLRYFLAGMLAFTLCGFGIPGPQGAASGGASFSGDLAGNTLTDGTNGYVTLDVPLTLGSGNDLEVERNAEGAFQVSNGAGTTNDGNLYLVSADEADGVFLSANGTAGVLEVGSTLGATNGTVQCATVQAASGQLTLNSPVTLDETTYMLTAPTAYNMTFNTAATNLGYVFYRGGTETLRFGIGSTNNIQPGNSGNLVLGTSGGTLAYLGHETAGALSFGSSANAENGTIYTGIYRAYGSDGTGDYGSLDHDGTSTVLTDNGTTFLSGGGANTTFAGTLTFGTGIGAVSQITGPSDQVFTITAGSARNLTLITSATNQNININPGGSNHLIVGNSAVNFYQPTRIRDDVPLQFGSGIDVFEQGELTTITDNTASTVFSVVTGNGDMAGITLTYTIQATDSTEYQAEHGTVRIALVDDSGGVVGSIAEDGDTQQALSSGTLTSTWSLVTTDDGSIEVQVTADTSLTPSTFQVRWHVIATGDVSLTVP